jgi:hypothetical protein
MIDHLIYRPEVEERHQASTESGSTLPDLYKAQNVDPREFRVLRVSLKLNQIYIPMKLI